MRKVIALVMTLCMILVLCACGQQTAPAVESTVAAENKAANTTGAYNIWVCDKSAVHQYHRTLKLGCEAAAKDLMMPRQSREMRRHSSICLPPQLQQSRMRYASVQSIRKQ